jgi:hypothetical protein
MATPNIANVTSIIWNTNSISLTTTSATALVSNAASSNKVYKIGSIVVANSSASAVNITINIYSAAAISGNASPIASAITVPANASLIVTDKLTGFYLLEDKSIGAVASSANALVVTTSWDEFA